MMILPARVQRCLQRKLPWSVAGQVLLSTDMARNTGLQAWRKDEPLKYLNVGLKGKAGRHDNIHLLVNLLGDGLPVYQWAGRRLGAGSFRC